MSQTILVTGGAGFIGANFIPYFMEQHPTYKVVNLDKLTYAGNLENLKEVENNPNYTFIQGDICDENLVEELFNKYNLKLDGVVSLEVPEDILIERMLERGKTSGRADDNIESIHYRFVEYDSKTKPVLDFYQHKNCLHPINGVGTIEGIFDDICKTIDSI